MFGKNKMVWHKIAESPADIPWQENNLCIVEVAGKKITLAKWNEKIFAFAWKCPHASGIMADGYIDPAGNIVCPLHRYRFSIKNGMNVSGEGFRMKTYSIEHRNDGIYAGWSENSFWL